jgi:hypothetical protein
MGAFVSLHRDSGPGGRTRFYFGIHNIAIRQNAMPKASQEKGRA